MFKVSFKKSALKELKNIPKREQILILTAIEDLKKNPFPHGYKKLVGQNVTYRIRIGNYRAIFKGTK